MRSISIFLLVILASLVIVCQTKKALEKKKVINRSILGGIKSLFESKFSDKCKAVLKKKETPDKKVSPIKSFGYPNFNIGTKSMELEPRAPLSVLNKIKIPIKIGVYDYFIAGDANELQAFFECFGDYEVIGSELNDNGKWVENSGTIKIQLSNLRSGPKVTESMVDMVFAMGLDKIKDYLDPKAIIGLKWFGSPKDLGDLNDLDKLKQAWNLAKKYIPLPENAVNKIAEISAKKIPLQDKIKEFTLLIKKEKEAISAFKTQWRGNKNVSKKLKVLVSLTMYSKPENSVRATYDTGKSKVTLKEIGSAVNTFMTKMATVLE
ncbi:uncharacterized protein LOC136085706 [Hydra vulgaris]|uniref:Uncharacterized protein LOC136085706 n=1 Tax=Hydra vulgaris TaxID=6087 RepID=A0ABM4CMQ7_HYDVU